MTMPDLSIVMTSLSGLPAVDECLRALERQRGAQSVEIIVVMCRQPAAANHLRHHFPQVRLVELPERLGIPELRAIGISHATANIIAVTEDGCRADENWLEEILKAHQSDYLAVGGAVEPGRITRLTDWAAYLCEYSACMLPIPLGEVTGIPGNNAAYKREALNYVEEPVMRTSWEYFLHREMRARGVKFLSVPTIVVSKNRSFGFGHFFMQRFHYSRSFAGMRRLQMTLAERMLYAALSPLLPLVMAWRIAGQVFRKRRHRREFFWSLPCLMVFLIVYAVGEWAGYTLGPGNSLMQVE